MGFRKFRNWFEFSNCADESSLSQAPVSKVMEADEEENDLIKQGNVITKSNLTWNQFDCQQGLIKFVHGALITIRFCVNSRPMQEPTDPSASRPLIGHFITFKSPWLADMSQGRPLLRPAQLSVSSGHLIDRRWRQYFTGGLCPAPVTWHWNWSSC